MLSPQELYALKLALEGKTAWREMNLPPLLRAQLERMTRQPGLLAPMLANLFDEMTVEAIGRVDTSKPFAQQASKSKRESYVPNLPKSARLSDKQMASATKVGTAVDEVVEWVAHLSPMTPRSFLVTGVHFGIALAVARRCAVPVHTNVFPQFYVLWVAPTSRYKKSTGSRPIRRWIMSAIPHMLLPEEMTPEAALLALAGRRPSNYDKLTPSDKALIDSGIPHAARRGIYLDEASSLFGGMKRKDHMQGFEELLLRGADSLDVHRRWTVAEGFFALRWMNLNMLGLTTPAGLARNIKAEDWETGLFARFLLMYPTEEAVYILPEITPENFQPPARAVAMLQTIDTRLPKPPSELDMLDNAPVGFPFLNATIAKPAHSAFRAYTQALTFDMLTGHESPDERLHGFYSRLPEYGLKMALNYAIVDWALAGETNTPHISEAHWVRGQQDAEMCRVATHHLFDRLEETDETRQEGRITAELSRRPEGLTRRDLHRLTKIDYKRLDTILEALGDSGEIVATQSGRTITYRSVTS